MSEVKSLGEQSQASAAEATPAAADSAAAPNAASSSAPTRPDWLPEAHWNPEAGSINFDSFGEHYGELATFHKTETDRVAALPQKPEDYRFDIPQDLEIPEGVEFAVDENSPALKAFREFAHQSKLDPAVAQGLYGLYLRDQVSQAAAINTRVREEQAKLGANHIARVESVRTFLEGHVGKDGAAALMRGVFTADQVKAFEKIMTRISGQNIAPLNAAAGEAEDPTKIPGYATMTFGERLAAIRRQRQAS